MYTLVVTGHRPNKLGGYGVSPLGLWIREQIKDTLIEARDAYGDELLGMTGMALGVDQWFAELCVAGGIEFDAAVPFVGQESVWPQAAQSHYHELLEKAREVHVVSKGSYTATKMQTRNEWMVIRANALLAVWDGTRGGTGNCVKFAEVTGLDPIIRIDPREFRRQQS